MPDRDPVVTAFPAAHSVRALPETIVNPAGVRAWLRQTMPRPDTAAALADALDLDPMQLVTYLARRGWRYAGIMPRTDNIAAWRHLNNDGPAAVIVCLDQGSAAGDLLLAHALEQVAAFEHRHPDIVLGDIAATPQPAAVSSIATSISARPTAGEQRMRGDYVDFRDLLHNSVTGAPIGNPSAAALHRARQLEGRWLRNLEGVNRGWVGLHTTVEAWCANPTIMERLHTVLAAYPDSVDAAALRDHDQARALTGHTPPTDPEPFSVIAEFTATAILGGPAARTAGTDTPAADPEPPSHHTETAGPATESSVAL